jgi:ribose 5-phosphate isomerase B
MKKIGMASDHAGYNLKTSLAKTLQAQGYEIVDFGAFSTESVDYPDFGHKLGDAVDNGTVEKGIAICFSGNGISMCLNRHRKVRAAICWNTETAALARQHNDANVCSLPAHFISDEQAREIVSTFLSTDFDGGRHTRRISKINQIQS